MFKISSELPLDIREKMRGGDGQVIFRDLLTPAEMNDKGRMFSVFTLEQDCSIGYHEHMDETEIYYIIRGTATVDDNGIPGTLYAGDTMITPHGTGHSIANNGAELLEVLAVILYK